MSSVAKQAKDNLETHGIDVELPSHVETHQKVNSTSEALNMLGAKSGLEAASYTHLNDRVDIYLPLAKHAAISNIEDQNTIDQINQVIKQNSDRFRETLMDIELGVEDEDVSYTSAIKNSKLQYEVATDPELTPDKDLIDSLESDFRNKVLEDTEHELVHASHYQNVIENEIEPLDKAFKKYITDIENLGEELSENDERRISEGISGVHDIQNSAAIKMIDDENYENILELAEEEYEKWNSEMLSIHTQYNDKADSVMNEVKDQIDSIRLEFEYDDLTKIAEQGIFGRPEDVSIDEAIDSLEREEPEPYTQLKQSVDDPDCIKNSLRKLDSIYKERSQKTEEYRENLIELAELVENAITRQAEIEGDFQGFMSPYIDRLKKGAEIPAEFTEPLAQFWTAYRRDNLDESGRNQVYDRLEAYDIDGAGETLDSVFETYDSTEGSKQERVSEVMSNQFDYLDQAKAT